LLAAKIFAVACRQFVASPWLPVASRPIFDKQPLVYLGEKKKVGVVVIFCWKTSGKGATITFSRRALTNSRVLTNSRSLTGSSLLTASLSSAVRVANRRLFTDSF